MNFKKMVFVSVVAMACGSKTDKTALPPVNEHVTEEQEIKLEDVEAQTKIDEAKADSMKRELGID
jgi:hypothetical protein